MCKKSCDTCFSYDSNDYYCKSLFDRVSAFSECINKNHWYWSPNREALENENEELKKEINQFKTQLEKMKCCMNCKHEFWDFDCFNCHLKRVCSRNTDWIVSEDITDRWECKE